MGKKLDYTELPNNETGERKRGKKKRNIIIALSILEIMQHRSIFLSWFLFIEKLYNN